MIFGLFSVSILVYDLINIYKNATSICFPHLHFLLKVGNELGTQAFFLIISENVSAENILKKPIENEVPWVTSHFC